jgi:acylphosphatase
MKKCVMIIIEGKVQGVGFRYSALKKAHELGVNGFVKNREDGSVYLEIEGESELIEQFTNWCRRGPAWAMVEKVDCQVIPYANFTSFVIR